VAKRGTRKSLRVSTRPARAPCSRRAVSQTASPSGTAPAYGRRLAVVRRGSPAGAARSERRGSAQGWSGRRGAEELAAAKQVEDACLHLELAGEPGTRETPWIFREGDQVVAVRGEADLRGPVLAVSLPDRASAVRAQPRHERDPKISHVAADSAVDEM